MLVGFSERHRASYNRLVAKLRQIEAKSASGTLTPCLRPENSQRLRRFLGEM